LVGRVLQSGAALSINVELVDTQDNTQLWGEQYRRESTEILTLQEEIAREISDRLRLQLSGEEQAQLAKQGTTNPEAYQAYLRGQHPIQTLTRLKCSSEHNRILKPIPGPITCRCIAQRNGRSPCQGSLLQLTFCEKRYRLAIR